MLDKVKVLKDSAAVMATKAKTRVKRGKEAGPTEKYLVALDIGTEYVKALIARVTDEAIDIIGTGRARQKLSDMQAGAIADIGGERTECCHWYCW